MSRRLTTEEVKRRLKVLSPSLKIMGEYKAWYSPLKCKCSCGHKWTTTWGDLVEGKKCPECLQRSRLQDVDYIAKVLRSRKIKMLGEYRGAHSPLKCKCLVCRHEWSPVWNNLRGHGCPKCKINKLASLKKLTLEEVQKRYKKLHPHVEVLEYSNTRSSVKCRCRKCGHVWKTRRWSRCRVCEPRAFGVSEEKVRRLVEKVTGWKFPKASPLEVPWLHGLHLDGYNKRHRAAFEYQGYQHYTRKNYFFLGSDYEKRKRFDALRRRDARKRMQCMRHGVSLVCIPYWKTERQVEAMVRNKVEV